MSLQLNHYREVPAPAEVGCRLLPVLLLAIDLAPSVADLAAWWRDHQGVLRQLSTPDLAAVLAAKERRKLMRVPGEA